MAEKSLLEVANQNGFVAQKISGDTMLSIIDDIDSSNISSSALGITTL